MTTSSRAPTRAPALYLAGFVDREPDGEVVPFSCRLPVPPSWDDRRPGAWAAERRARRAYFATLDALRTGAIDPDEEAKLQRLAQDLRSATALEAMRHLQRILDFVRESAGRVVVPTPPAPLASVVITAPPGGSTRPPDLEARYRWALEWLQARRYLVGKSPRVEWRIRRVTPQVLQSVGRRG